jgi:nucleotide sugar dehydrogenase
LDAKIISVQNCETAEAVKLFDMTYRDVNIALANEFAKFCQARGIDAVETIDAANTNPHSRILYPGAGVGGHCTPVYPYFLIEKANKLGVELTLPREARKINDSMPKYAVNLLKKELGKLSGKSILVLGLAYRGGVKETRFSPSIEIIKKLKEEGAKVFLHDPLFTEKELEHYAKPAKLDAPPKLDGIILATAHKEYTKLDLEKIKATGVKVFVDGRNLLNKKRFDTIKVTYRGIGRF